MLHGSQREHQHVWMRSHAGEAVEQLTRQFSVVSAIEPEHAQSSRFYYVYVLVQKKGQQKNQLGRKKWRLVLSQNRTRDLFPKNKLLLRCGESGVTLNLTYQV